MIHCKKPIPSLDRAPRQPQLSQCFIKNLSKHSRRIQALSYLFSTRAIKTADDEKDMTNFEDGKEVKRSFLDKFAFFTN